MASRTATRDRMTLDSDALGEHPEAESQSVRKASRRTPRTPKDIPASPASPQRKHMDSVLQSMESRSGARQNTKHITRPSTTSKWKLARLAIGPTADESHLTEIQKILKKVTGEYTSVTQKEDVLEAIMAEAAHASYECLGRYEMEPSYTTRVAMNTAAMKGKTGEIYRICQKIGAADLDGFPDEDDRLVQQHGLREFMAQPGEITLLPEELLEGLHCRSGLALPLQRGKKATFTKALSGLMSKNNMKVSGAVGQAAASDLLAERGFVSRCGDWCLIGLVNGQGSPKVSGALTMYVAQEMPKAIFQNPAFVSSFPDVAKGLTDAFAKVHTSAAMQLDVTLTGASVTVVLLNKEHVWIAHVGDCRCVLAVPDTAGNAREFHMLPQRLTEDHKLCVKKEFDRTKEAGAEVRKLVHDKVCRLFVGESSYPSLAVTRGLGHRLGHTVGVTHKPSICKLVRKDLPEGSYMLLGSGGVWATMSDTTAVNWVNRNLDDPQQAAMSLAHEAMSRWQEPGSLAKGNLNANMPDSFGTFLIHLAETDEEPAAISPRKFVPGSDMTTAIKLPWREVKSPDRHQQLRQIMTLATPREGMAARVMDVPSSRR